MVPWGTGNPISPGYLNTLVFLTGKPPPLSVSVGGGSMSRQLVMRLRMKESMQRLRSIKQREAQAGWEETRGDKCMPLAAEPFMHA